MLSVDYSYLLSVYDVYCFGVVLLEFVFGKFGISELVNYLWLEWVFFVINVKDKEGVFKLVDLLFIVDEDFMEEVWVMVIIVKVCLNFKFFKWFNMKYVLKVLENFYKVVCDESFCELLVV